MHRMRSQPRDGSYRSSSAPPTMDQTDLASFGSLEVKPGEEYRRDPAYYQYYYSQRPLDPRLPTPLCSMQALQQMAPLPSPVQPPVTPPSQRDTPSEEKSLIDRIQEDFPRTPSPVYAESTKPGSGGSPPQELSVQVAHQDAQYIPVQQETSGMPLGYQPTMMPQPSMMVPPPGMGVININGCPQLVPLAMMSQFHVPVTSPINNPQQQFVNPQSNADLQRQVFELQRQMEMHLSMQQQAMHKQQPNENSTTTRRGGVRNNRRRNGHGDDRGKGGKGKGGKKAGKRSVGAPPYLAGVLSLLQTEMRPGGQGCSALELSQVEEHIAELARDQYGSRYLQQILAESSPEHYKMIWSQIFPCTVALSKDVFGNFLVQKLMQHGNCMMADQLTEKLIPDALELSMHMYGCRVVQRAVEVSSHTPRNQIMAQLAGKESELLRNSNGNHVIQKCIQMAPSSSLSLAVVSIFSSECLQFAVDEYGCRIMQRLLEHCEPEQVSPILECVLSNVVTLSKNQYGNYVIQHLLLNGTDRTYKAIADQIRTHVLHMSLHKFASNVIEKVLGIPELCAAVVDEVVTAHMEHTSPDEDSPLMAMMKDQYGNYVVQKMIEHSEASPRDSLLKCAREAASQLRSGSYGKHILARVEKLLGS